MRREAHYIPGVNSGAPEGFAVSAPLIESVALLMLQTR